MNKLPDRRKTPWQTRANAFLLWRSNGQKLLPVSEELNLARPTVKVIVNEFLDAGFSESPRTSMPSDTLRKLQEAHLNEVGNSWKGGVLLEAKVPEQYVREINGEDRVESISVPGTSATALDWHLKGTDLEEAFSQALASMNDYRAQCDLLWGDIASRMKVLTPLPLVTLQLPVLSESNPGIYHALVDLVYHRLFRILDKPIAPGDDWVYWSRDETNPNIVLANHKPVAVESPKEHGLAQKAVETFFTEDSLDAYKRRAAQLRLYHSDLKYVSGLFVKETSKVNAETLNLGICPWCPYPEARLVKTERRND